MTAVMRRAEAVLHALIMMSSSMSPSLMSPGAVDCRMNTGGRGRLALSSHDPFLCAEGWELESMYHLHLAHSLQQ